MSACGGTEREPVEACARAPAAAPGNAVAAPDAPFVGMLEQPDTGVLLARLDALSLRPVSRRVRLGEYHDAWSLSPDGSRLALGVSAPGLHGRAGIFIVDLAAMKVVRRIETGGAAEALAWVAPDRLVAALVVDGTVLVDPRTGDILQRWPSLSEP